MKKIVVLALVVILCVGAIVGFAACKPDKDDGLIRLNEVTHSIFYAPLYVAINNGYFEEEGLRIELTNGGGSDKTMTAIMSGQADIGLLGPEAAVYVKLGGSSNYPVVFGQLTKKDGSFIVGRKAIENFKWADLDGSEIIGGRPGGMPAMSLEYALDKNNLRESVTINYDVDFDLITAAFEGGTGDYCTMFEPIASNYEALGKGHVITSVGAAAGDMPYTCFMATKKYINEQPEKVTKFMRAIIKAIDFVTTGSDEEVATALAPSFATTSREIIIRAVNAYKAIDAYKTTPIMEESEFDNLMEVLLFAKAIKQRVAYGDIIDNSIARELLKN